MQIQDKANARWANALKRVMKSFEARKYMNDQFRGVKQPIEGHAGVYSL